MRWLSERLDVVEEVFSLPDTQSRCELEEAGLFESESDHGYEEDLGVADGLRLSYTMLDQEHDDEKFFTPMEMAFSCHDVEDVFFMPTEATFPRHARVRRAQDASPTISEQFLTDIFDVIAKLRLRQEEVKVCLISPEYLCHSTHSQINRR
jgi:hypothetical protein